MVYQLPPSSPACLWVSRSGVRKDWHQRELEEELPVLEEAILDLPVLEGGARCQSVAPAVKVGTPDVLGNKRRLEADMWKSCGMPGNGIRAMGRGP